jgi:ribonuclease P protein component
VTKRGVRSTRPLLVGYLGQCMSSNQRIGLVVGRQVGCAVQRNLVKRRLRALGREQLSRLPEHGQLVIRARFGAAQASFSELQKQLDGVVSGLLRKAGAVTQ